MPTKTWPSWLFGSIVGASRRTRPSTSPAPITRTLAGWLTASLAMSAVGTRPTRSYSLRAMMLNSLAFCRRRGDHARYRRGDVLAAAVGQIEAGERLARGDGVAGIGHHLGDLEPEPLGPHRRLLPRHDDARDLDDIGKAGFRGLEHGDRRPLRLIRIIRRARRLRRKAEQGRRDESGRNAQRSERAEIRHRHFRPVVSNVIRYQKAADTRRLPQGQLGLATANEFHSRANAILFK